MIANEIVSGMVWWWSLPYSELKYGNVLRNLDNFRAIYVLRFFSFIAAKKLHSNNVFASFNYSSILTCIINNPWHLILSCQSNLIHSLQNIKFFFNCSANSKKLHIVILLCLMFKRWNVNFRVQFSFKMLVLKKLCIFNS